MARENEIGVVPGGLEQRPVPAAGLVRLRAVGSPSLGLVAELTGPVLPSGYGDFDSTPRRGKAPIIDRARKGSLTLPLPILLDRWSTGGSVEPEIKVLERMYGRGEDSAWPPPILIVEGFGVPHSYTRNADLRWVLSGDPQWGDDIRTRGTVGLRSYVPVTVTLVQYEAPDGIEDAAGNTTRRYYTVPKAGGSNTLRKLARAKNVTVTKLRTLNKGVRAVPADPDKTIKRGTKVRYA